MNKPSVPAAALTHAGKFHADDVFSTALLKLLRPDIAVRRSFTIPDNFDGLVYDIGGGAYDHHQEDAPVRENKVPYAAFGLLWREYGGQVMERGDAALAAEEAQDFDEKFVQPLDEDDNKGTGNAVAGLISAFNPSWDSEESFDACFERAVDFASVILHNKLESVFSIQRARKLVKQALGDAQDHIVILPRYAPWKQILAGTDADFVVYPSQRGGYCAQIVPEDAREGGSRYRFPEVWAGKSSEELPALSGVSTLTFCHNGRLLIAADTLEDILKACHLTRELQDENTAHH